MTKYNYILPNKLHSISEGRYPIGATFYDSEGKCRYQYTSSGIKYNGTTLEPFVGEICLARESTCPEGYDAVSITDPGLLFIAAVNSKSGTDSISGHDHTHAWTTKNAEYGGTDDQLYFITAVSAISTSSGSYKYMRFKYCVSNYNYRGFYE